MKDQPAVSDMVANLEMAYTLVIGRDEPGSVDELLTACHQQAPSPMRYATN